MAAILKFIFQAAVVVVGFIVAVVVVIVIHKNAEQEAIGSPPNASSNRSGENVSYDPRQQIERKYAEAVTSRIRQCLRGMLATYLHQGIRSRALLIAKSSEMCKNAATDGLSGNHRAAMLLSLEPWAVYELEIILKYGTSHIRVETISPNFP